MYLFYFQKSRNVIFSGTVLDYLFIYVFLLFPEVQKCYVFRHCALSKTGSSQWSVFETEITMSWINTNTVNKYFFASSVTHRSTSRYMQIKLSGNEWSRLFQNHCIMIPLIWWTKLYCSCEYTSLWVLCNNSCLTKCRKVSSFLV